MGILAQYQFLVYSNVSRPYEKLLATAKWWKQKWYGHVAKSDGLTKVILQGTVECSRRRSKEKLGWQHHGVDRQILLWNTSRSREIWWRRPPWHAPTAPRRAKGPRQGNGEHFRFWCKTYRRFHVDFSTISVSCNVSVYRSTAVIIMWRHETISGSSTMSLYVSYNLSKASH